MTVTRRPIPLTPQRQPRRPRRRQPRPAATTTTIEAVVARIEAEFAERYANVTRSRGHRTCRAHVRGYGADRSRWRLRVQPPHPDQRGARPGGGRESGRLRARRNWDGPPGQRGIDIPASTPGAHDGVWSEPPKACSAETSSIPMSTPTPSRSTAPRPPRRSTSSGRSCTGQLKVSPTAWTRMATGSPARRSTSPR